MQTRLVAAALVALAIAAPLQAVQRDNQQIFRDLQREILRYPQFTIFDSIHLGVDEGVVTLDGKVTMPHKRSDIEKLAARVTGVTEVRNRIDVLPVSTFDDDLRRRIAQGIYGNSSFWRHASMANPPIHIIVERGHVTLEGVVASEVERMLARSIAAQSDALSVTSDLRTESEAARETVSSIRPIF